jgi:DNA-binding Xre family transcriptional regulator
VSASPINPPAEGQAMGLIGMVGSWYKVGNMQIAVLQLETLLNGRSLYWLAKATGIDYKTIHKHVHHQSTGIRFDHIASLCAVLECAPQDLFTIEDVKKKKAKR